LWLDRFAAVKNAEAKASEPRKSNGGGSSRRLI